MMAPNRITFPAFCRALIEAGLLRAQDKVRKVVIVAELGKVVQVYVETDGDERLLGVLSTLEGTAVRQVQNKDQ